METSVELISVVPVKPGRFLVTLRLHVVNGTNEVFTEDFTEPISLTADPQTLVPRLAPRMKDRVGRWAAARGLSDRLHAADISGLVSRELTRVG